MKRPGACLAALAALLALPAQAGEAVPRLDPIEIRTRTIPLYPAEPGRLEAGALIYRGGLVLSSSDERFGGLSGLVIDETGRTALAISDRGYWLVVALDWADGVVTGVSDARIAPLLRPDGIPLAGDAADAEGLARLGEDRLAVAFERQDRIWLYEPPVGAVPLAKPVEGGRAFDRLVYNKGLEGLARAPDGALWAFSERSLDREGHLKAWRLWRLEDVGGGAPSLAAHRLAHRAPFDVTDAAFLSTGDLLVLERSFNPIGGPGMRLRHVSAEALAGQETMAGRELARLGSDSAIDNMEALAILERDGAVQLLMLSDDNYRRAQRTVLLQFALPAAALTPRHSPDADGSAAAAENRE